MRTRSFAILLAVALAGSILAAPGVASASSGTEACFLRAINRARAAAGRAALVSQSDLVAAARRHSGRMAAARTIFHNDSLPREIRGWYAIGENVGMGPSCSAIHDMFMSSSSHRTNILRAAFNQVGVGVVIRDGTIYVTEVFVGRRSASGTVARAAPPVRRPVRRAKPKPAPAPSAPPAHAPPQIIDVMLVLLGMDAPAIDPATGAALGV